MVASKLVTEGAKGDTTQHNGIRAGTAESVLFRLRKRKRAKRWVNLSGFGPAPQGSHQVTASGGPDKLADLLMVEGDPLADITILQDRRRLNMAMHDGKLIDIQN